MSVAGCFECWYLSDVAIIKLALAEAIVVTTAALVPVGLMVGAWSRYLRLRAHGTVHATGEQRLALLRSHAVFRFLSNATTLLALLLGGLIIQLGYMTLTTAQY
jgi:hypothetical protein